MDIKLEKKPWYIRLTATIWRDGVTFLNPFLIYVVTLSLGPSKLRIEQTTYR